MTSGFAQTLTGVSPNQGERGASLSITLSGSNTNFLIATGTKSGWLEQGSNIIPFGVSTNSSATQTSGILNIPCDASPGQYDVRYSDTDPGTPYDTLTLGAGFEVLPDIVPPTYSPTSGTIGNQLTVTFNSTCPMFGTSSSTANSSAWISNGTDLLLLSSMQLQSPNSGTGILDLPCSANPGNYGMYMSVSNLGNPTSDTILFTVPFVLNGGITSGLLPSSGLTGDIIALDITSGCNLFNAGANVSIDGFVTLGSDTLLLDNAFAISSQQIAANLELPCDAPPGDYDVFITVTDANTMITDSIQIGATFTVLTSLTPNTGEQGDQLTLTFSNPSGTFGTSSGVLNKAWITNGVDDIVLSNVQISTPPYLTGDLSIPQNATLGYYDFYVCQSDTVAQTNDTTLANCGFTILAYSTTGAVVQAASDQIELWPNPVDEAAWLSFANPANETFALNLYNSEGKLVFTSKNNTGSMVRIERNGLPPGMYFVQVQTARRMLATKILLR